MFHGRVSSGSHIIGNLKTLCHSQILHWSCNVQSSNQMHVLLCHVCWRTHPKQLAICPANPYFKTVAKRWVSFFYQSPIPSACYQHPPSPPIRNLVSIHCQDHENGLVIFSWWVESYLRPLRGTMLAAKVIKSLAKITVSTSRWFKSTLMNWCDSHGSSHGIKIHKFPDHWCCKNCRDLLGRIKLKVLQVAF